MAEICTEYRAATDEEFDKFTKDCDSEENWTICFENREKTVKVWDQPSDKSSINVVKLFAIFSDIDAIVLYDVLHDPEYRSVWDENMVEGYNIEQIDACNDVGYYSAKAPTGIANRDFCNERSWRVKDNKEYIIMNHSVLHPKCPEKKGFVRANSIKTGYLVRQREESGCTLTYLTQTDPRGWIPSWLVNTVTKKYAPQIIGKLEKAAKGYTQWKDQHDPNKKPWRQ
jgi:hypothetical protein